MLLLGNKIKTIIYFVLRKIYNYIINFICILVLHQEQLDCGWFIVILVWSLHKYTRKNCIVIFFLVLKILTISLMIIFLSIPCNERWTWNMFLILVINDSSGAMLKETLSSKGWSLNEVEELVIWFVAYWMLL